MTALVIALASISILSASAAGYCWGRNDGAAAERQALL